MKTVNRVYLIIALFATLIVGLVWLFQFQLAAAVAMRVYAGGEGLWAKAQKDALHSLDHYALSHDEADYQAYRRLIQVPLGDQQARIELQKPNPDLAIARKGFLQGRNHPVDIEYAIAFFRRFPQNGHMSQVIRHWAAADRLIAEMNGVAEALHEEIASGRNKPEAVRSYRIRLDDINRRVTVEEDLFSFTLAEASRWAYDVSRNLGYAIAMLFVALGVGLSRPIITRIRATENTLFESEQRLRRSIDTARDAIITLVGESGAITAWNPAAEAMFGYSEEEALGRVLHDFLAPPRFREAMMKGMAHFATTGEGAVIGKTLELAALHKNGTEFPIELSLSAMQIRGKWHATGIIRDITERKQVEEKLRLHGMIERSMAEAAYLIRTCDGVIVFTNPAFDRMFGCEPGELVGKHVSIVNAPGEKSPEAVANEIIDCLMRTGVWNGEVHNIKKDGTTFWCHANVFTFAHPEYGQVWLSMHQDITERKQAEEALRVSALKYQLLFESSRDALMLLAPPSWMFTGANQATLQLFGASSMADFTALGPWNVSPSLQPDGRLSSEKVQEMIAIAMREGSHFFEWEHQRLDGQPFAADVLMTRMEVGKDVFLQVTVRDISERQRTEAKLKLFRTLLDNSSDTIEVLDPVTLRLLDINETECRTLGYSREELLSMSVSDIDRAISADSLKKIEAKLQQSGQAQFETVHWRKDGSTFPVEVNATLIELDKPILLSIARDITERKRVEQELRESEARYRRITEGITDYLYTVRIENGRAVGTTHSPACVKVTGYTAEELAANPDLWIQMVVPEDREVVSEYVREILAGNDGAPIEHRIIKKNGETRWISNSIILFRDAAGKLLSYEGVMKDVTARKQLEKKSLEADIRVKAALEEAIGAIAATLEQRDPYTAGHQRRVAQLSLAIGAEMGLAPEVLEGIHFGGLIHDIGKIAVPAEILGKSGHLTDTEFGLIKVHAEAGYEILKGIAFPWPVADMVRQHHERLDGSGYPQGIKGEQIVLEARILAVADTLEAMSANRPYRPGLGIGAALDAITQGRGTQFDPAVVDACVQLYQQNRLPPP